MVRPLPPIYFYVPQPYFPSEMPTSADENWQGFGLGIYAWTLQTYLRLRSQNFPCELVSTLPDAGIIIIHHNALRAHQNRLKPTAKQFIICIKAESQPYAYAHLHIVQNPLEQKPGHSYYLPHWPQPGLLPRSPERGDRFQTIAYFGHTASLAPELNRPEWKTQLQELGLTWSPLANSNHWNRYNTIDNGWNDYRPVDAVVAIRSFNARQLRQQRHYRAKPATKLYNAWLAGVPAVLGCESAYRAERQSELDYLEVDSPQAAIAALQRLRDDDLLRRAIVENGHQRARSIHPAQITERWCHFLQEIAVPTYQQWCHQPSWVQRAKMQQTMLRSRSIRLQNQCWQMTSKLFPVSRL